MAKFAEARRTTATLLADNPDNPSRIFAHAQSEYWVGYASFRAKDHITARDRFNAYLRLARRLVRIDANNADWVREVAYAQGNLCTLALMAEAEASPDDISCAASLELMQKLLAKKPGDAAAMKDVANRHAWMSEFFEKQGALRKALDQRTRQLAIYQQLLSEDPNDADLKELQIGGLIESARIYRAMDDSQTAESRRERALIALAQLIRLDPQNQRWKNLQKRALTIAETSNKGD